MGLFLTQLPLVLSCYFQRKIYIYGGVRFVRTRNTGLGIQDEVHLVFT